MDIMQAIADELGMDMQVEDMQFDAIIAAVSSGKVDVGAAGFTVTEDRQKNVDFTDTYITTKQEIIVKDSQSGSSIGIKEKLYDNFVKDNRYMYIVKGFGNTIVITIFAVMPVSYTHLNNLYATASKLICYNDEIINTCMCIHGIKSRPVNGLKAQLNPNGLYFV